MDDRGRFYTDDNTKAALEDRAGLRLDISTQKPPKNAVAIEDEKIAKELAGMNRRARRIFLGVSVKPKIGTRVLILTPDRAVLSAVVMRTRPNREFVACIRPRRHKKNGRFSACDVCFVCSGEEWLPE